MTSIEQCKRSLQAFKGHITRAINNCNSIISSETIDIDKLATSISFLERKWPGYEEAYMTLEASIIASDTVSDMSSEQEEYYAVWDNYQDNLAKFKSRLRNLGENSTTVAPRVGAVATPKLPIIKLPTFSGDYTEYESFFDQFQAQIGKRCDLEPVTKLQYLKSQLKGSALDLIKNIPSVDANYQHAVDALREVYGDGERIKRGILSKILDITSPSNNRNDLESFRISLINLTRALKDKTDYSNCEWIIAFMFQRKLPKTTIHQLYLKYGKNYFSIEEMTDGLKNLVSHMDMEDCQMSKKSKVNSPSPTNGKQNSKVDIGTYSYHKKADQFKSNSKTNLQNKGKSACVYCSGRHYTSECDIYATVATRQSRLIELNRCSRCVSTQHTADNCNMMLLDCKRCHKGKHHTALCVFKVKSKSSSVQEEPRTQTTQQSVMSVKGKVKSKSTALPTATLEVRNEHTKQNLYTRAFFDQGSQCTFIKEDLVNKLQLKISGKIRLAMSGFLQSKDYEEYNLVRPTVRLGNRLKRITAVVVERLPDRISVPGLTRVTKMLKEAGLELADKHLTSDVIDGIELVIGGDFYGEFITGLATYSQTRLSRSSGGYLIYGQIPNKETDCSENVHNALVARLCIQPDPTEIGQLREESEVEIHKLWDLDTIGIDTQKPPPDDCLAYHSYIDSVQFTGNKYYVRLPWKLNCPQLPSNYSVALGQLKSLTNTLVTRNEVEVYHDVIQTQLDNDFIEKVSAASPTEPCHYLPHHGVKKDSATTPLRIVFNCSAKRSGQPSLNDCLMKGPSLTEKLGDVLLRFRTNKYAFSADISKAFLRVGLQECDRDFTRFLWYENPKNLTFPPVTYRFKSVLFGATCSPFLLQATIDYHLKNSDNIYKTLISQNLYVDNFQGSVDSQQRLFDVYENANMELAKANLPLRVWVSNSEALNSRIEEDFKDYKVPSSTSILGLYWDVQNDALSIKPPVIVDHSSLSKRKLLSLISSVFDPLGLLAPVTIRGKLLVKEAWQMKCGWDEPLPPSFTEEWLKLKYDFIKSNTILFPRNVGQENKACTLHLFCDASSKAYGAVAYLVSDGKSNILTAKARVTPMKSRSLPQLELTAIQVGTQLAKYVTNILKALNTENVFIWSDSEAALQWIRNNNSKIVYVKNRVASIRELSSNFNFNYVPSSSNPADLLSRGTSLDKLSKEALWMHGPSWLNHPNEWPTQKETVVSVNTLVEAASCDPIFKASDMSSLTKIINVTNNVFKFIKAIKPSGQLPGAMTYWLQYIQLHHYKEEYEYLATKTRLGEEKLSLVRSLGLYMDSDTKLIHCRGRLSNSDIGIPAKFPILLPRRSWLTSLIVRRAHEQTLHGGVAETLGLVREQYWIPKGRQQIKNENRKCLVCRVMDGRKMKLPGPPALPKERVIHTEPFHTVGVDYTGSITISNPTNNGFDKYYVCLFTCATTRAVHLELAKDLTAQTFINLLRRFIARRSSPTVIISDNASNFKGAEKFLQNLRKDPLVKAHLEKHLIEWRFIPPRAPWMGGFYERLIGVVKSCIRKVLFKRKISEDELRTILTEVEMRVNNRPLTYIDDDVNHPQPLTPAHLIYGKRLQPMPVDVEDQSTDPDYLGVDELQHRYTFICERIKHWERVWKKEYLMSLRERFYGAQPPSDKDTLHVGDIVIIETEGNRDSWPLGRITAKHPDKSGITRVVEVVSKGTTSLKTINKLIPLELQCDPDGTKTSEVQYKARRGAFIKAQQAIRDLSDGNVV